MTTIPVQVYLPLKGSYAFDTITRKSGVVGSIRPTGDIILDFEGNKYGATNIVTYADRVMQAAGRHVVRYPTVARMVVPIREVMAIGYWDESLGRVMIVNDSRYELLKEWLDMPDGIPAHELLARGAKWGR